MMINEINKFASRIPRDLVHIYMHISKAIKTQLSCIAHRKTTQLSAIYLSALYNRALVDPFVIYSTNGIL